MVAETTALALLGNCFRRSSTVYVRMMRWSSSNPMGSIVRYGAFATLDSI